MNTSIWHESDHPDPCLITSHPDFYQEVYSMPPDEKTPLLPRRAIEYCPIDFLDTLYNAITRTNSIVFQLHNLEIREYSEIPFACRHGYAVYRIVSCFDEYPEGTWIHVFVAENNDIVGIRIESDKSHT